MPTLTAVLQGVFLFCVLFLAYAYIVFPVLTALRGLLIRRPVRSAPQTPPASLIICCHNEAAGIAAKLQNVRELDYPRERLQVIVASDGSSDGTNEIVRQAAVPGLELIELPRGGKAQALNAAAARATGELLIFSDANSQYARDALRQLAAPFADPAVGGVAGDQIYAKARDSGLAASGERSYWSFDRWLKLMQSRAGHVTSATGAIYAVRRELFQPVPEGVTDDFVTSTRVIAQHRRLVFAPEAKCYEPVAGTARAEFGRKVRVITRGLRGVLAVKELLNPFRFRFYSLQLLSHKVLRRLAAVPVLLLAIVTPLLWSEGPAYRVLTVLQAAFFSAAAVGWIWSRSGRKAPRLLALPYFFCLVNAAVLAAVVNVLRGRRIVIWNPERSGHADAAAADVPGGSNAGNVDTGNVNASGGAGGIPHCEAAPGKFAGAPRGAEPVR